MLVKEGERGATGKETGSNGGNDNLVPRPSPSGRGPGTFSHMSGVTDRANYVNVSVM